jgi:hypothetical protein
MENLIKILLSVLFFGCLADLPYGYFLLVRWLAFVGFFYLAFQSYGRGVFTMAFLFIALGLLFQPFLKVALGRQLWNFVDVLLAVLLIFSVLRNLNFRTKNR